MLDTELLTPPPPTPAELLRVLVDVYGPTDAHYDRQIAQETLATQMLVESFGPADPISQLAQAYLAHRRDPTPNEQVAHDRFARLTDLCSRLQSELEQVFEDA